jgi:alpha-L-arabinofuranosidase
VLKGSAPRIVATLTPNNDAAAAGRGPGPGPGGSGSGSGSGSDSGSGSAGAAGAAWSVSFVPGVEWGTFTANFTAAASSLNTTLRIQTDSGAGGGEWWLGSVSLQPIQGVWRGMRTDVVDSLAATGFHGLFRYPGGCYAPFYRWKVGLLDADSRPPIETPPGYCDAVSGGVNAYTDGMMENGVSTDDYLALCERIGMIPAITVRFQEGRTGPGGDVQEAIDWVEYVNGDVSTPYGALRAARGHPQPYNVSYWYLGNEISQQARYPDYPNEPSGMPPPGVAEYRQMLLAIVPSMLAASPRTPLRLLTVSAGGAWDAAWADAVGEHVYATSFHDGYMDEPKVFTESAVTACAKRPRNDFMASVAALRKSLDATNRSIAISADEWGLGPPWRVREFGVAHGMYAAGFLGAITRGARANDLQMSNYFEPVNEGAVQVLPFGSLLTPVGLVMQLFSKHTGGGLLEVRCTGAPTDDLDNTATVSADGKTLVVTVANLNAVGWGAYDVAVQLDGWAHSLPGSVVTLEATGYGRSDMFHSLNMSAPVDGGVATLHVPPFSVVQATFAAV